MLLFSAHLVHSLFSGFDGDLSPGTLGFLPLVQVVAAHRVSSVIGRGSPANQHLWSGAVQESDGWWTGRNICSNGQRKVKGHTEEGQRSQAAEFYCESQPHHVCYELLMTQISDYLIHSVFYSWNNLNN